MGINLDFRLLDIELELIALEEHLELIEQHLPSLKQKEERLLEERREAEHLSPQDPEWQTKFREYRRRVDIILPRFFNNPFLISLYSVLEASITDIANHIKDKKGEKLSINDLRGSFLDRSKKYYNCVLNFQLYNDSANWQRAQMLADLRHALAHTNGRFDMMKEGTQDKIRDWEEKDRGISIYSGFLVPEKEFLQETFTMVRDMLDGLVERYKGWESNYAA